MARKGGVAIASWSFGYAAARAAGESVAAGGGCVEATVAGLSGAGRLSSVSGHAQAADGVPVYAQLIHGLCP